MIFFNKNNVVRKPFNVVAEHVGVMIPCLAIIVASFLLAPSDLEERRGVVKLMPQCMFKKVTGLPCPSCGMSRAFCSISRRRIADAFGYNPLSMLLYPIIVAGIVIPPLSLAQYWRRRRRRDG
jgi:hypothetical protein